MPAIAVVSFASASASDSGEYEGGNPLFFIILVVILGGLTLLMNRFFTKRAKRRMDSVTEDSEDAFAVRIAPAPPFPQDVARVRALLGDTSPDARIFRTTVPVVMVKSGALTIEDQKAGHIITIPAAAITSITSGMSTIKPKGTLGRFKFPSVMVHLDRYGATDTLTLTPVVDAYEKSTPAQAEVLAIRLSVRLGLGKAEPAADAPN